MEVSGQIHAPAALSPVLIVWESGWLPEPVWTTCAYRYSKSDPSAIQPVASRCTDCAITDLRYIES
jgi:hypothetical protein